MRLFANAGGFTKGDRKEENPDRQSQNQNVRNAFHIKLPDNATS